VTDNRLRIGSRTSPLALAQTEEVIVELRSLIPNWDFEVVPFVTDGDSRNSTPISNLGRGAFTTDIQNALVNGEIDLAIHSAKDLPNTLPEGLSIFCISSRKDPRDVMINKWGVPLKEMPSGAVIGTGSPRRKAILKSLRNDITVVPIRGNVGTRIDKINRENIDAVVLAAAGLVRLNRLEEVNEFFDTDIFVPDVGQGIIAVQVRSEDIATFSLLNEIQHQSTQIALIAERAFLNALGGGCKVPVAAYASIEGDAVNLISVASDHEGSRLYKVQSTDSISDPVEAGLNIARKLLDSGAGAIL
tara:strand:- start:106 stop:1014 length:909 start_codon:yes stop_codon:yes gene_type:complete